MLPLHECGQESAMFAFMRVSPSTTMPPALSCLVLSWPVLPEKIAAFLIAAHAQYRDLRAADLIAM